MRLPVWLRDSPLANRNYTLFLVGAFVSSLGMVGERQVGARDVLKAAAWTYVAAALTALLTFLYYLMLIMGRRD